MRDHLHAAFLATPSVNRWIQDNRFITMQHRLLLKKLSPEEMLHLMKLTFDYSSKQTHGVDVFRRSTYMYILYATRTMRVAIPPNVYLYIIYMYRYNVQVYIIPTSFCPQSLVVYLPDTSNCL